MRLQTLKIKALPGISEPFRVDPAHAVPAINVVTGPNASGKTSLLRAVRAVLYDRSYSDHRYSLHATFVTDDGRTLAVENNGGRSHWFENGEPIDRPALPDARFAGCYLLQFEDLAAWESHSEAALAERIARELTGGYDIDKARRDFAWSRQSAARPAKTLEAAEQARQAVRREYQALHEDERRLAELEAELDRADRAAREVDRIDQAEQYLEARRQCRRLEESRQAMPADMHLLTGDELTRLEQLDEQRRAARKKREAAERERKDAVERLAGSGLEEAAIDAGALTEPRARLKELEERLTRLAYEHEHRNDAEATLAARRSQLGGPPEVEPAPINDDTVRQAAAHLDALRERDAEIRSLEHTRDRLPAADEGADAPESLRTARDALRRWLATAEGVRQASRRWIDWLLLGVPLGAAAVAAGAVIHWSYLLLLVVAALAIAVHWVMADPERPTRAARRAFEATGCSGPAAWVREEVAARVAELETRIANAEVHAARVAEREACERSLQAAHHKREQLVEQLGETARDLGFDPQRLDEGLVAWLETVESYRAAREARDRHVARVDTLDREIASLRDRLVASLRAYGEAPETTDPTPAMLGQGLDRLETRIKDRDRARAEIDAAGERIHEADDQLADIDGQRRHLFAARHLDVDDVDALQARVQQLEQWQQLNRQLNEATGQERQARKPLEAADRRDLVELADEGRARELERRRERAEASAVRARDLRHRIARIQESIRQAEGQRRLEAAEGDAQSARDALEAVLDDALQRSAAAFLLDDVQRAVRAVERPATLAQAQEWFRVFTNAEYELDVRLGDPARFVAHETTTGADKELRELSSGTRMQLLLAVRLGFAVHAEGDRGRLPLFLDEALATTDPRRFREVAQALQLIARRDQRQVFYLTADPAERARWQQVLGDDEIHVVDLPELRTAAAAVAAPETLLPEPAAPLPSPDDVGEAEFLRRLDVPALDPWRDIDAVHVFYLLGDWMTMLHRLARAGIVRVGQLRVLLSGHALEAELDADERRLLAARIEAATVWIAAWREGRGHPVDRAVLAASPMRRSTKFEPVAAVAERDGRDAQAFIAALRGRAVHGLHRPMIDQLERYLREQNYLPEHEPLSAEGIHQRVLEAFHTHLGFEQAGVEAQRLERRLEAGVDVSARSAVAS